MMRRQQHRRLAQCPGAPQPAFRGLFDVAGQQQRIIIIAAGLAQGHVHVKLLAPAVVVPPSDPAGRWGNQIGPRTGLVNLIGWGTGESSFVFRRFQTGLIQNYALLLLAGVFVFLSVYLLAM